MRRETVRDLAGDTRADIRHWCGPKAAARTHAHLEDRRTSERSCGCSDRIYARICVCRRGVRRDQLLTQPTEHRSFRTPSMMAATLTSATPSSVAHGALIALTERGGIGLQEGTIMLA